MTCTWKVSERASMVLYVYWKGNWDNDCKCLEIQLPVTRRFGTAGWGTDQSKKYSLTKTYLECNISHIATTVATINITLAGTGTRPTYTRIPRSGHLAAVPRESYTLSWYPDLNLLRSVALSLWVDLISLASPFPLVGESPTSHYADGSLGPAWRG